MPLNPVGSSDDIAALRVYRPVQMVVRANLAPVGGTLRVSPRLGYSLSTSFSLRSGNWSDPDATLPLSYAFYATHGSSSTLNTAAALQLRHFNTTTLLQVRPTGHHHALPHVPQ